MHNDRPKCFSRAMLFRISCSWLCALCVVDWPVVMDWQEKRWTTKKICPMQHKTTSRMKMSLFVVFTCKLRLKCCIDVVGQLFFWLASIARYRIDKLFHSLFIHKHNKSPTRVMKRQKKKKNGNDDMPPCERKLFQLEILLWFCFMISIIWHVALRQNYHHQFSWKIQITNNNNINNRTKNEKKKW